ncbi:TRAP-type C4-dicarboxylate transport system permease small subunit [Hydrogenispora ethanolica]|jgi:TRAP-type C4-dicarboxylate transport system permease small subunit|uniref:TRAP-type C4-dicarboxylate transport system permease small subunit n=1 Tax=Hydrogenispora ethanolica TaxID=1082276 RepID=A0A4R1RC02_HYDET|nr:TRAP transporter small permease [Hydrogenispora ethanolica]TCL63286.1 TRAP-type C4-dicarboxylate transport system permease small subunit [Hydrogenispora ethanolica]
MQKEAWLLWLGRLERLITAATAFIMLVLSVLVCYQVFSRYVLRSSPFWIEELSVVAMMWIGLLGAAGCVWTDSNMTLELIVSRVPEKLRVWMKFLSDLIVAGFAWLLFQQGIILVRNTMTATMATLSLPMGYTYLILPLSGGFMVLFSLIKALRRLIRFYGAKGANDSA